MVAFAVNLVLVQYEMAFFGLRAIRGKRKADGLRQLLGLRQICDGTLSDEERLLGTHSPFQRQLGRMAHAVGILAYNDMTLFKAQQPLCFYAKGLDPNVMAS